MNSISASTKFKVGMAQNSSPVFVQEPAFFAYFGQTTVISQAAYDPDGDSLAYVLTPCYQSANQTVTYNPGYSPTAPLGPGWNCSLHPQTGLLTITPNANAAYQIAPVGIRVNEYRNGQLIGSIWRDVRLVIIGSDGNALPQVSASQNPINGTLSGNTLHSVPGAAASFDLVLTDPDSGQALQSITTPLSYYGGAVMVAQVGASTNPMTVRITATAPTSGSKTFILPFDDNNCPLVGRQYFSFEVAADTALLLASGIATPTPCDSAIGTIDLSVTASALPLGFLWNNGATTEDLTGLTTGIYTVQITDANGQTLSDTFVVTGGDLTLAFAESWASCLPNSGSLTALVTGGIPPYIYTWTTGSTAQTISGLSPAGYHVYATDTTGCLGSASYVLKQPDSCVVVFKGNVYFDNDGNCQCQPSEVGIPFQLIQGGNGGGSFSDLGGYFEVLADTGFNSFTISSLYPTSPCADDTLQELAVAYGVDSTGNDFARNVTVNRPHDLSVMLGGTPVRPGFGNAVWITVQNLSFDTTFCTLSYRFDSLFTLAALPPAAAYDSLTRTLTWSNIGPLTKSQTYTITCSFTAPASTLLGTAVTDTAWVIATPADTSLWNNRSMLSRWVTGSYDPNDKAVSPKGETAEGYIRSTDNVLTYTVQFQNTGTDTAFFVTLRDTLDAEPWMPTST